MRYFKRARKHWIPAYAGMTCAVLIIVAGFVPAAQAAQLVDRVVAVVNNDVITQRDLQQAMETLGGALNEAFPGLSQAAVRHKALEQLIDDRLLNQEMVKEGIAVTEEEMAQAVQRVIQENQLTMEQFQQALAARNMSMEAFQEQMASQIRQMKFVQTKVGKDVRLRDEDLRNYYKRSRVSARQGEKIRITTVTYPLADDANARAQRSAVKRARKIAQEARARDFRKVVTHELKDGKVIVDDQPLTSINTLSPILMSKVKKMDVGDISEPFITSQGAVFVKLFERTSANDADFERRKPQLQQALYQTKMTGALEQYLGKLRAKAYIEIRK